jgi:hypothetical protein
MDTKKTLSIAGSVDIAATLGREKREELGIGERRLPLNLEEARKYLEKSEVLREGLGDNFVTKYLAVNEVCISQFLIKSSYPPLKQFLDASRASIRRPRVDGAPKNCSDVLVITSDCRMGTSVVQHDLHLG